MYLFLSWLFSFYFDIFLNKKQQLLEHTDSLRGSSVKIGTLKRRLAWPLRKDETHTSRSVNNLSMLRAKASCLVIYVSLSIYLSLSIYIYIERERYIERDTYITKQLAFARSIDKLFTLLDVCVSSLRRGHANLLFSVPILTDDPRRESVCSSSCCFLFKKISK